MIDFWLGKKIVHFLKWFFKNQTLKYKDLNLKSTLELHSLSVQVTYLLLVYKLVEFLINKK